MLVLETVRLVSNTERCRQHRHDLLAMPIINAPNHILTHCRPPALLFDGQQYLAGPGRCCVQLRRKVLGIALQDFRPDEVVVICYI